MSSPVALHSVVRDSDGLHLHLINPKTGHRTRMVSQDAETDEEVSRGDLVKGYKFEKNRCVRPGDDDFEQARIDHSSTLAIGRFLNEAKLQGEGIAPERPIDSGPGTAGTS
ncbi:MAG TPA: Ku protein [Rhodopila sp.]